MDLRPFIASKYGHAVEKHGDEYAVPCPDCDEGKRTKSFRLWYNVKTNKGVCYRCGKGFSDALGFVSFVERLSLADAMIFLRENVSSSTSLEALKKKLTEEPEEKSERSELKVIDLPREFIRCRESNRSRWPKYLLERVRPSQDILTHGIGWCDEGYYRDRMIVPLRMHGEVVSFEARDMTRRKEKKVLYPVGTKTGRMLFNYDVAKRLPRVVVVESVMDALRVGPSAVALYGTNLSRHHVALLAATDAVELVALFDGDAAGRAAAEDLLEAIGPLRRVRAVYLPRGKDPDDYRRLELVGRLVERGGSLVERLRASM